MAPLTQADIPLTALVRPNLALSSSSEIELRYDGSRPPIEVLAELTRLGWEGATPCPPPATAIDWSQPDPVRGTRHSIRPFAGVTTASIHGTERHRASAMEQARLVLERHGLSTGGPSDDPARRAAVAASPGSRPTIRFEVVVPPSLAADVRSLISDLATVEAQEPDVWTSSTTWRGSHTTEQHEARRFVLAVPADRRDDLLTALSAIRPWALRPLDR